MKKQVVKVKPVGEWEKDFLIFELDKIGILKEWLKIHNNYEIRTTGHPTKVKFVEMQGNGHERGSYDISMKNIGDLAGFLEPEIRQFLKCELIEMDEKEIAALPEFVGW